MYKLSNTILDVKGFEVNKTKISIIHKNLREQCVLEINQMPVLQFEFRSLTRGLHEKFTVVSDISKTIYIFNSLELLKEIDGFSLSEQAYSSHEIIISKRIAKGNYEKYIYDISNANLQLLSFVPSFISLKSLYIEENNTLRSLSLLTGEYEWEVDLGGRKYNLAGDELEAKIRTIIGMIENSLYVWLDNKCLVEIDIATGQIKSETFPLHELEEKGIITAVMLPQYHEPDQSIYFFYQDYLVQVHLPTQNTTLLWQDANYNIGSFQISDSTIYFIGSYEKGAFFRNHIGVFDRKKNDVVWMQKVIELNTESYNNLKEIQASDTKIYVLDTEGTLYIFEREEVA